jgi:hypothetical protein
MTATSKTRQVDELMERASEALAATRYFEAEQHAVKALGLSRSASDFERMERIILPLQESRRQRLQQALECGVVTILDAPVTEQMEVEPGCYLVQPPQVGADARRLRLAALHHEVPLAVVCREPTTRLKMVPIVAIAPGVTVRTTVDPPDDPENVDLAWFVAALETLGDFAIESVDPGLATLKRLDTLLARMDAIPDHEGLHQALADACREAGQEAAEAD